MKYRATTISDKLYYLITGYLTKIGGIAWGGEYYAWSGGDGGGGGGDQGGGGGDHRDGLDHIGRAADEIAVHVFGGADDQRVEHHDVSHREEGDKATSNFTSVSRTTFTK